MELFVDIVEVLPPEKINGRSIPMSLARCNVCKREYKARTNNIKTRGRSVCSKCRAKISPNYKNDIHKEDLYATWNLLRRRVDNTDLKKQSKDSYYDGITMCEEWKDFKTFKTWCIDNGWEKGKKLSIDRIDGLGNYSPDNCRIATQSTQNANKGKRKDNSTGYSGIALSGRPNQPYKASLVFEGTTYFQKRFKTIKEAIEYRNKVITENNLPHPIQEYKE